MAYPIFPSLTRAPKYKSTRKLEDGTIKDAMESGYVATRPRFTRQRRTFGVTYENICGEDVRVLDQFEVSTVQGMAGAFYFPNLLPNGSFEIAAVPGSGQVASGWVASDSVYDAALAPAFTCTQDNTNPSDGLYILTFSSLGLTVNYPTYYEEAATTVASFPVASNDVYTFNGSVFAHNALPSQVVGKLFGRLIVTYSDGSTQTVSQVIGSASQGFTPTTATFTVPVVFVLAGSPPISAVSAVFAIVAQLNNTVSTVGTTVTAGACVFSVDSVGLALTTPSQAYGRMPGSSPLGTPVRLTKQFALKDNSYAGGQPTYDCTFEVTEL